MSRILTLLLATLLAIGLAACDNKTPETTDLEALADPEAPAEQEAPADEALPTVEVSAEGTEFDPPIEKAQLPDGVYYCDMGTVHYARTVKGDNKCPLCNMFLTPHNVEESDDAHDDDHDH